MSTLSCFICLCANEYLCNAAPETDVSTLLVCILVAGNVQAQKEKLLSTRALVNQAFEKGQQHMDISTYPGTLLLHGMSEFVLYFV